MNDSSATHPDAGPPPAPTLAELTADLAAEHADLDALVAGLSEEEWRTPTPAAGWNIADQIGHLGFFDHAAVQAATDEEAFNASVAAALESGEDMVEKALAEPRAMTGAELLGWWRDARAQLIATAEAMDESQRVAWYGPSMSSRSFFTARLMETWAHGQDVADALGRQRSPTDRLRHIAQLGFITRGWSYIVRGQVAPGEPVRVELTAPSGAIWAWGEADAENRISGPALDFCLLTTQRRNVADTTLNVTGEAASDWLSVAQAFAGGATDPRPPLSEAGA